METLAISLSPLRRGAHPVHYTTYSCCREGDDAESRVCETFFTHRIVKHSDMCWKSWKSFTYSPLTDESGAISWKHTPATNRSPVSRSRSAFRRQSATSRRTSS